jgi:putative addiction module component (TIGR02574 family)
MCSAKVLVMKPFAEEVVRQALSLDETDRAEVAARLLDSLEETDSETEDAWVAELERRGAELEAGAVQGVSWEDLRERLMRGRPTRAARGVTLAARRGQTLGHGV